MATKASTEAASKAKTTAKKLKEKEVRTTELTTEIRLWDEFVTVDLMKQCPQDMLATATYVAKPYIPIKLIRKIARNFWWTVNVVSHQHNITGDGIIMSYDVIVEIGDKAYNWTATDYVAGKSVRKSLDGQSSRIKALAIKDALKWAYPFFDINFDEADDAEYKQKIAIETDEPLVPTEKPDTNGETTAPAELDAPVATATKQKVTQLDAIIAQMWRMKSAETLKQFVMSSSEAIKRLSEQERTQISNEYQRLVKELGEKR